MRITDYELFAVPPRWLFLRLETNHGSVGWGEPIVQGRLETVRTAVEELLEGYLIGTDPLRIEHHWRTLYQGGYFRGGPVLMSALSGIDQALWDIKGKHYGCPVYELIGGHVRERIMVHGWIGGDTPAQMTTEAGRLKDHGYRAVKMNLPMKEFQRLETPSAVRNIVDRVAAVREEVGDNFLVGVDLHGRVSEPMVARVVKALEPYEPMFVDQPTTPEHSDRSVDVASQTSIPLSTGERLYSRYDFRPVLERGDVSVVQPDVTHVGGISELRKITDLAETFNVTVVPHCPLGPVAFAASLQVDFSAHNAVLQEQDLNLHNPDSDIGLEYLEQPDDFSFADGFVERPTGDGLGIEIDTEHVRARSKADVNWQNPVWHYEDGSIAEW